MPRFRQTAEILSTMRHKENIRNVGIIAHIDHGKTTLTDSLLAEAGLIPSRIAGRARVLDYLEEEQLRGITIKTANISLLHRTDTQSYVINLIDTPGHVDFSDKVSGAMRAIDGAIVVVDAVEGIMPQTETVTRQALIERVKPILFINKIDRLIRELKLSETEIRNRFTEIVNDFNNIIEIDGEQHYKREWKADPTKESVIFGSALEKWGFTLKSAKDKSIRFHGMITDYYQKGSSELERRLPLHEAVLEAIVRKLPDPRQAQKYRLEKIWKGDLSSRLRQGMLECADDAPMVICITNVLIEKDEQVVVGRIFAGTVSSGDRVYLLTSKQEAQVENVLLFMGATRETVDQLTAGNIVGLTGLSSLRAGETIVSPDFAAQMTPFARIEVTQPVMTVAIEPADPRNLHRIAEGMEKLTLSDPSTVTSISKETGEHLLGGMGELQLEIAVKSLKKISGVADLKVSPPTVNYRECTGQVGKTARATNQRRTITMAVQVRPAIQTDKSDSQNHRWTEDSKGNLLSSQMEPDKAGHWRDYIISSFKSFCMAGPLCNEPITNLEIIIVNAKISETSENSEDVMAVFGRAAYGSILTASPTLLEPIYRIKMLAHTEFVGRCTRIIVQKRGRVSGIEQRGSNTLIMGYVPVAETFGMPTTLRSSTSGQASWQWSFDNWQELPDDLANRLIRQLRVKKGLPPEIPKPQSFALIE